MTNNNDLWEVDRGDYVNIITELRAEISRLTSELDAAQKTIAHWESHDFEDDIDDATAEISEQLVDARRDLSIANAELGRTRAALAEAERERDKARSRAARIMADFRRVLKWEGHGQFYSKAILDARIAERDKARSALRDTQRERDKARPEPMKYRRTIRALVVAFRDALHLTRRVASDETWDMWLQLVQRQAAERREAERGQAREARNG